MGPRTVLVPLDGSDVAEAALPFAEAIARAGGDTLRLLGVVDTGPHSRLSRSAEVRDYLAITEREQAEAYLHTRARILQQRGVMTSVMAVSGDPVEQILAAAAEADVRMLVMSTHGRGGWQRLYLGSVADKVMRLAPNPVLLVPASTGNTAAGTVQLGAILVPLDGSPPAEAALPLAGELAAAASATVTLMRVQPWLTTTTLAYPYVPELGTIEAQLESDAKDYLTTLAARLPAGVVSDSVVLRGTPAVELAEYVAAHAIDLVVMTTRGHGGLSRLVLGSTADRLVRSGVPALLIHPVVAPEASQEERSAALSAGGRAQE